MRKKKGEGFCLKVSREEGEGRREKKGKANPDGRPCGTNPLRFVVE